LRTIPAPKEGDWVGRDCSLPLGQVLPELRIHHTTVGAAAGAG